MVQQGGHALPPRRAAVLDTFQHRCQGLAALGIGLGTGPVGAQVDLRQEAGGGDSVRLEIGLDLRELWGEGLPGGTAGLAGLLLPDQVLGGIPDLLALGIAFDPRQILHRQLGGAPQAAPAVVAQAVVTVLRVGVWWGATVR